MLTAETLLSPGMRRAGSRLLPCSLIAAALFAAVPGTLVRAEVRLLPAPREANWDGEVEIPEGIRITVPGHDAEDEFAAKDLEEAAQNAGVKVGRGYTVVLLRAGSSEGKAALEEDHLKLTPEMAAEGYALAIGQKRAVIVAESACRR
jgi:hypothetical protein